MPPRPDTGIALFVAFHAVTYFNDAQMLLLWRVLWPRQGFWTTSINSHAVHGQIAVRFFTPECGIGSEATDRLVAPVVSLVEDDKWVWNSGLRGSSKLLWVKTCSRANVHSLDYLQADRWYLTVLMTFRTSHVSEYLKIDLRCSAVSPLRRAWNRQVSPSLTDFVHRVVIVYILKAL
jgi:hypothetical protein